MVSIGLIAALANLGKSVAPFKKGPDYIDAGWLALAAGQPCHNLDPFLFSEATVCHSFLHHCREKDIAVVEGNRGLYDGLDVSGTTSTASLAKLIAAPVILCLDCTKSTRTMAAVVMGCLHFDPVVHIAGVVLNRVAGSRHERILRSSIESHCGVEVVGSIPKLSSRDFPERHMGLTPTPEHGTAEDAIAAATRVAESHLDMDAISRIADDAARRPVTCQPGSRDVLVCDAAAVAPEYEGLQPPRIGVIKDSAFQFYYPENIDALAAAGGDIVEISPLTAEGLPDVDALYMGGGFPETHARALSENLKFRTAVKSAAFSGMPIYAECGGLIYLGEALVMDQTYPMTGVLPIVFGFSKRPQGHGYTIVSVDRENPYFTVGSELKGHEFHYSSVLQWNGTDADLVFAMQKGRGVIDGRDGVCIENVLATYTHLHALGCPQWAASIVRLAASHMSSKAVIE